MITLNNAIMTTATSPRHSSPSSPSSTISLPEHVSQAVQNQLDLISSFRLWLDSHHLTGCNAASTRSKISSKLVSHVDKYRNRIEYMQTEYQELVPAGKEKQDGAVPDDAWKLQVNESESDELRLLVAVGDDDDTTEVKFGNREELESAMGVCLVPVLFVSI